MSDLHVRPIIDVSYTVPVGKELSSIHLDMLKHPCTTSARMRIRDTPPAVVTQG
jgi:hypothetical protein